MAKLVSTLPLTLNSIKTTKAVGLLFNLIIQMSRKRVSSGHLYLDMSRKLFVSCDKCLHVTEFFSQLGHSICKCAGPTGLLVSLTSSKRCPAAWQAVLQTCERELLKSSIIRWLTVVMWGKSRSLSRALQSSITSASPFKAVFLSKQSKIQKAGSKSYFGKFCVSRLNQLGQISLFFRKFTRTKTRGF